MSTPEGIVLKSVIEYLAVTGVWHRRMNTGASVIESGGKRRFVKYGSSGMADILCIIEGRAVWLECKAGKGKQSELQEVFQRGVENVGALYAVVRSIDDVKEFLARYEA